MGILKSVLELITSIANLARDIVNWWRQTPQGAFDSQSQSTPNLPHPDVYATFDEMLRLLTKGRKGRHLLRTVCSSKSNKCLLPLLVFELLPHCRDPRVIGDVLKRMSSLDVREVLKSFHHSCPALPQMLAGLCRIHAINSNNKDMDESSLKEIYSRTLAVSRSLLLAYSKRREDCTSGNKLSETVECATEALQDLLERERTSSALQLSPMQAHTLASIPSLLQDFSDWSMHGEDSRLGVEATESINIVVNTWGRILVEYSRRWPDDLAGHFKNTLVFLPSILLRSDFEHGSIRQTLAEFAHTTRGLLCGLARRSVVEYNQLMSELCANLSPSCASGALSGFHNLLLNCSQHDACLFSEVLFREIFDVVWSTRDGKCHVRIDPPIAERTVGDLYALILQCRAACANQTQWLLDLRPIVTGALNNSGDTQDVQLKGVYSYVGKMLAEIEKPVAVGTIPIEERRLKARQKRHLKGRSCDDAIDQGGKEEPSETEQGS